MFDFYKKSLHRRLLELNIAAIAHQVTGKCLDLGSRNRRYDDLFSNAESITAIDIVPDREKNVMAGDIRKLPFKNSIFDSVTSFETFEYVLEIEDAIAEAYRVLKDNGVLIFSVPFLNPVHGSGDVMDAETDLIRLTGRCWIKVLSSYFIDVNVLNFGGRLSLAFDTVFDRIRKSNRFVRTVFFPVCLLMQKLVVFIDQKERILRYPMGYIIQCRKDPK